VSANNDVTSGKVARPGGSRFRWALALLGVASLPAASLLSASSASAASTPTITIEYDATAVGVQGVIEPSMIFRGTGFIPRAHSDIFISVHNETAATSTFRFANIGTSTLASRVCTHTTPSYCFIGYQDGDLRPARLFLGESSPGRGRAPRCGDVLTAGAMDIPPKGVTVYSNEVTFRFPCDTYVPRPPIGVTP
jgi:hypothetical protein